MIVTYRNDNTDEFSKYLTSSVNTNKLSSNWAISFPYPLIVSHVFVPVSDSFLQVTEFYTNEKQAAGKLLHILQLLVIKLYHVRLFRSTTWTPTVDNAQEVGCHGNFQTQGRCTLFISRNEVKNNYDYKYSHRYCAVYQPQTHSGVCIILH